MTLRLEPARSFRARLQGLVGRPPPAPGSALWLAPCRAVHTIGMRYRIDVVFIDRDGCVVKVVAGLRPMRIAGCWRARAVAELAVGEAARLGIRQGARLAPPGSRG